MGLKTTLSEKLPQHFSYRDSLNSSGTVSRKTSTASDYTPEHTLVHDTRAPVIDETNVSFSTESCMSVSEQLPKHSVPPSKDPPQNKDDTDALAAELNDSLTQKDVKLMPGQKVDLKLFILRQDSNSDGGEKNRSADVCGNGFSEVKSVEHVQGESGSGAGEQVESKGEKNGEGQLKVPPQRKISRFLVS